MAKLKTSIAIETKTLTVLKKAAKAENRSLSNYIENAITKLLPGVTKELKK
jgi:hypothetical protein